jgi:hypothetical protein
LPNRSHAGSGAVEKLQELPHVVGREQWGLRTIGLMDFDSKFPKRGGTLKVAEAVEAAPIGKTEASGLMGGLGLEYRGKLLRFAHYISKKNSGLLLHLPYGLYMYTDLKAKKL